MVLSAVQRIRESVHRLIPCLIRSIFQGVDRTAQATPSVIMTALPNDADQQTVANGSTS
jgi:hypothetical protein